MTSKEEDLARDLFSITFVSGALYSRGSDQLPTFFVPSAGSSLPPSLKSQLLNMKKLLSNTKFIRPEKPLRPSS